MESGIEASGLRVAQRPPPTCEHEMCVCVFFAQCHDALLPLRLGPGTLILLSRVEGQPAACAVACSSWLSLELSSPDLCINHTSHICLLRGPGLAEQVLGCDVLSHAVPIDALNVAFVIFIYGEDVRRHLQLLSLIHI